jgi:hypothetical protein
VKKGFIDMSGDGLNLSSKGVLETSIIETIEDYLSKSDKLEWILIMSSFMFAQ